MNFLLGITGINQFKNELDDVNEVLKKGTEKRSIPWRHEKLWGICIRNLHVIEETKLFCRKHYAYIYIYMYRSE